MKTIEMFNDEEDRHHHPHLSIIAITIFVIMIIITIMKMMRARDDVAYFLHEYMPQYVALTILIQIIKWNKINIDFHRKIKTYNHAYRRYAAKSDQVHFPFIL